MYIHTQHKCTALFCSINRPDYISKTNKLLIESPSFHLVWNTVSFKAQVTLARHSCKRI